jgi:hypothetical protein
MWHEHPDQHFIFPARLDLHAFRNLDSSRYVIIFAATFFRRVAIGILLIAHGIVRPGSITIFKGVFGSCFAFVLTNMPPNPTYAHQNHFYDSVSNSGEVAAGWLDVFWESVYPRLDPDGDARSNALFSFADKMAILDAVRRVPLAVDKQLGSCCFRDLERPGATSTAAGGAPACQGGGVRGASVGLRRVDADWKHRSRRDAIRALDAVAEFFRKNEPSSPVP